MTSPLANPSRTIEVLKRHGLYTKKSLGQHFLIDDNVLGRMIALADLAGDETVVEVGPGIGTLTVALCAAAGSVVSVERDADLLDVLAETTSGCARFALVNADAVSVDTVALEKPFGPPIALVANLPYHVAATVVLRFLEEMPALRSVTVMVQSEVADRMAASPGSRTYGSYTVKLRLHARCSGRFGVPPGCFLPPPRVESTVIRLDRHVLTDDPVLRARAARVADAAFAQRRKTLRNSLRAALGAPGPRIDDALDAAGVDGALRAEMLPPEAFIEIARRLLETSNENPAPAS